MKDRLDNIFSPQQNRLQRGFTEKSSSLNAAFIVSETITQYAADRELLYLTTLDAQKAFDTVNHEILFNKLYHLGVNGDLWLLLRNLYREATVKVKWDGNTSNSFQLRQGTKQGAKLSTTLYKCYHNSTLDAIQQSGIGAKIGLINVASPTCADDTALQTSNHTEMQALLDIVQFCTTQDLVTINPDKSEILAFKHAKQHMVSIGDSEIEYKDKITHLGITRDISNKLNTSDRIQTGRNTIYSLLGPGLNTRKGLSPKVAYKVWKTFVIPRILHGAEVMYITSQDLEQLERLQRKMCRHMQSLPDRTASTAVYALLGVEPVEAVLDRNRLSLFLNISRLKGSVENEILSRQICLANPCSNQFATVIRRILQKYELPDITVLFKHPPTKESWKKTMYKNMNEYWRSKWTEDQNSKSSLQYLKIQEKPLKNPHNLWQAVAPKSHEVMRAEIKARLVTGTYMLQTKTAKFNHTPAQTVCQLCRKEDETVSHFLLKCSQLESTRQKHLHRVIKLANEWATDGYNQLLEQGLITQLILDCTHDSICQVLHPSRQQLIDMERCTQVLVFELHQERALYLVTCSPVDIVASPDTLKTQ